MGLFNQSLDTSNLPITSNFLEAEGFVPQEVTYNSWRDVPGYVKTILDGNKKIKLHFVKVYKEEDNYILYDPLFYIHLGYVEDFFENINTLVETVADYSHFMNRAMLKMRIYEQLRQRNKERMIRDVERQIGTLKESLEMMQPSFDDVKPFLGYGII